MQSVSNTNILMRAQQLSGYINSRGIAGIISLSQQENNPEAFYGENSGFSNTGTDNTLVGINSGYSNNGSNIVAVGKDSAYNNTGSNNTILGKSSGYNNSGANNTLVGINSGYANNGSDIVAVGKDSGYNNTGSNNILLGRSSGYNNSGIETVAIGKNSGYNNNSPYNTMIGNYSGYQASAGYNTMIGYESGLNRSGEASVLIGNGSGRNSSSYGLIAIGLESGANDISVPDSRNVFIGARSGQNNTSGISNTFVGGNSGRSNTTGRYNTFIGKDASIDNSTGSSNIVVGRSSNTTNISNGIVIGNSSSATVNSGIAIGNSLTANQPGFFAKPIRSSVSLTDRTMIYNTSTSEISYSSTKTFVINHPLDKDKLLVHGCLEGPESGVYYRGKGEIINGECKIDLPLYVHFAKDFTINITPIGKPRLMSCSEFIIPDNKTENPHFYAYGEGLFYWTVYGKRDNINVEPDKDKIKICGDGPYKWIDIQNT